MSLESAVIGIVCGMVVGACVRLFVPDREFMSLGVSIVLGIAGGVMAQLAYSLVPLAGPTTASVHYWAGWIVTALGALLMVWIYPYVAPRSWPK